VTRPKVEVIFGIRNQNQHLNRLARNVERLRVERPYKEDIDRVRDLGIDELFFMVVTDEETIDNFLSLMDEYGVSCPVNSKSCFVKQGGRFISSLNGGARSSWTARRHCRRRCVFSRATMPAGLQGKNIRITVGLA